MDYAQITERGQIRAAFQVLRKILKTGSKIYPRTVGFRGESHRQRVHWHGKYGFWTVVDANLVANRFWISFGTQNPSDYSERTSLSITCETNVPKFGIDRRSGGAFYRKGGDIYLCHSGRIGGGGKGIGKGPFLSWLRGQFRITWPDPGIIIGKLSGARFLSDIAKFIHTADQFKAEVKIRGVSIKNLSGMPILL